jgi:hypothetical protein
LVSFIAWPHFLKKKPLVHLKRRRVDFDIKAKRIPAHDGSDSYSVVIKTNSKYMPFN